jgi:hypothetical protein
VSDALRAALLGRLAATVATALGVMRGFAMMMVLDNAFA